MAAARGASIKEGDGASVAETEVAVEVEAADRR